MTLTHFLLTYFLYQDHNNSYSIAWVRQPSQHSSRHWRSCHLRLQQPSSHQVLTGHQRTNMMISSSLWSLWIVGLPYRGSWKRQESWRTQCVSITSWISSVIKVDGDTTIGSLLVQMLKHRERVLVHSWITCSQRWTMKFQFAAESTSLKRPLSCPVRHPMSWLIAYEPWQTTATSQWITRRNRMCSTIWSVP